MSSLHKICLPVHICITGLHMYMMRGTLNQPVGYSLRYFLRKDQLLLSEQYLENCQSEFGKFFLLKNAQALLEGFHQTSRRKNF